jgi:hypothetical protein
LDFQVTLSIRQAYLIPAGFTLCNRTVRGEKVIS